jgi:hypothetical protein
MTVSTNNDDIKSFYDALYDKILKPDLFDAAGATSQGAETSYAFLGASAQKL